MACRRISASTARRVGLALLLGAAAWPVSHAVASPVKGTVTANDSRSGRRYFGYWRVENGSVPIAPPAGRTDTVVVVAGPKGQAPSAKTYSVEINGFAAVPNVLVVGPGSVVEIKNADRVAHELHVPDQASFMSPERLAPGSIRRQKFSTTGAYEIRCALYPHVTLSVVVVDSPHYAIADEKGAFKVADVPDGKATVKVWAQGRWAAEQAVDVKAGAPDLTIQLAEAARRGASSDATSE